MGSSEQANLEKLFPSCFQRITGRSAPSFSAAYYPYVGLRHTLRFRNKRLLIRVSDLIQDSPEEVTRSVLGLLICKLLKLTPPEGARETYRTYVKTPSVQARIRRSRRSRGKKRLTSPRGIVFDLENLFDRLNRSYFSGQLQIRQLSWSATSSRSRLGHFDPAHGAIVINRRLDNPLVPSYVVAFVLYHEMLHAKLDRLGSGGGHDKEFRTAENRYQHYRQAKSFIAKNF